MIFPLGCSRFRSDPRAVVERYFRSLDTGRTDEAAGFMCSKVLDGSTPSELNARLQEASLRVRQRQGIQSIGIRNERRIQADPGGVAVETDITFRNGQKEQWTVYLIQEKGNWRIASASSFSDVQSIWQPADQSPPSRQP